MSQIIPNTGDTSVAAMAVALQLVEAGSGESSLKEFLKAYKAILTATAISKSMPEKIDVEEIMRDYKGGS